MKPIGKLKTLSKINYQSKKKQKFIHVTLSDSDSDSDFTNIPKSNLFITPLIEKQTKNLVYLSESIPPNDLNLFSELPDAKLIELSNKLPLHSNFPSQKIESDSWFPIQKTTLVNKDKSSFTKLIINKTNDNCIALPNLDLKRLQILNKHNKPNKVRSKSKHVLHDDTKKSCRFIVTTNHDSIIYGRECGDICLHKRDRCKEHLTSKQKTYDKFAPNICQHIITQKSRGKDRKGMICGDFTFDSKNSKYCKNHIARHPELQKQNSSDKTCLRSFHVRFYPTFRQKKLFVSIFGGARFTFNQCVQDKVKLDEYDKLELKKIYVTDLPNKYEFLKRTPKAIRDFALVEYLTTLNNSQCAYENKLATEKWNIENCDNYKPKNIKKPEIHYRTKKGTQSISINKDDTDIINKELYIYKEIFNEEPIEFTFRRKKDKRLNKILDGTLYHDIKIIKTITDKYYVCFTDDNIKKEKKSEMKEEEIKVCAVDPGGRTMLTTYCENEIYELGANMNEELGKLFKIKDEWSKKYSKAIRDIKKKKISNDEMIKIRNEFRKINEKIRNKIDDLHYKAINKLMEYSIILIPRMKVHKMIEKEDLPKYAKRILQTLSHGLFIKRLICKGEQEGKYIEIVSEYLTSQICGKCFSKYKTKEKIYECNKCGLKIDRDINGARNIYIKYIAYILSLFSAKSS